MTTRARNLILTIAAFALVAFALRTDGLSGETRNALIAAAFAFVTGLWMHSGRPPGGGLAAISLACAAQLAYGCQGGGVHWNGWRGVPAPQEAPRAQFAAGHIALIPQAASPIPASTAGLYAKSSDAYPRLVDTAGVEYIAGTAWRLRQSAGAPGGVATGDLWYDTGTNTFVYRDNSGNVTLANSGSYVALTGAQTVAGAKTWSDAAVFNGNVTLGNAAADAIAIKGALAIDNAANTFAVALTHTATANRAVTLPDAAGEICLIAATQTLTNKSIVASQLTGDIAIARMSTALTAPGAIGGSTPAAGTFTALAANTSLSIASAPQTGATFFKACTITSAAAATPVACLAAADVPAALSAKLAKWHAYVNGGTGWGTTATCVIEDTAGNDLITIAVAALTSNTFIDDGSANVTKEERYRIGTGGAADAGLQISCNANGTGSDLVFVLSGSVQ